MLCFLDGNKYHYSTCHGICKPQWTQFWMCFELVNYSRSLHIRVTGTNWPMCHGICNPQWTQFWRCFEMVDYSRSLRIRVNGTNRLILHGICNPQWTQFLHTLCCEFFIKCLLCVKHWLNSNVLISHGLVNYKMMSVDMKCPIKLPSLKFIQVTHKNKSPISKKMQHQCYTVKEVNVVYGNNCCLLR
jgi:hypothetical protein